MNSIVPYVFYTESKNMSRFSNKISAKPQFPKFKKLELEDRDWMQEYIQKYPPYSDFNFTSLWSWNINDQAEVTVLNNNLVIKFHDYISSEPFYTFLGKYKIRETVSTLLELSLKNNIIPKLKLVPEVVINSIKSPHNLKILEDFDNNDYVYDIKKLRYLSGDKYRGKRNFINRFKRKYSTCNYALLDISTSMAQIEIKNLFIKWSNQMHKSSSEIITEYKALTRLFKIANEKDLLTVGIKVENKLVGFTISEILHEYYGILHFEKADVNYTGVYEYLTHQTAEILSKHNCILYNFEQDLGLEGLRKSKKSWNPEKYLKKFTVYKV